MTQVQVIRQLARSLALQVGEVLDELPEQTDRLAVLAAQGAVDEDVERLCRTINRAMREARR